MQCSVSTTTPKSKNYKTTGRETEGPPARPAPFGQSSRNLAATAPSQQYVPGPHYQKAKARKRHRESLGGLYGGGGGGRRANPVHLFKSFAIDGKIEARACMSFTGYLILSQIPPTMPVWALVAEAHLLVPDQKRHLQITVQFIGHCVYWAFYII